MHDQISISYQFYSTFLGTKTSKKVLNNIPLSTNHIQYDVPGIQVDRHKNVLKRGSTMVKH